MTKTSVRVPKISVSEQCGCNMHNLCAWSGCQCDCHKHKSVLITLDPDHLENKVHWRRKKNCR